jgi:hypothetical protein
MLPVGGRGGGRIEGSDKYEKDNNMEIWEDFDEEQFDDDWKQELADNPDLTVDGFGVWTPDYKIAYSGQLFGEKQAELANFDRAKLIRWWKATNEAGPGFWKEQRKWRPITRLIAPRRFNTWDVIPVGVLIVFGIWLLMEFKKSRRDVVPKGRIPEHAWYRTVPDTIWYSYRYMGRGS